VLLPFDFALRNPELKLEEGEGEGEGCSSSRSERAGLGVEGESDLKAMASSSLLDAPLEDPTPELVVWFVEAFDAGVLACESSLVRLGVGVAFWGVERLVPLYCLQVWSTDSRAAIVWMTLARCSLTSSDSPATASSCSLLRLEGSQLDGIRSGRSRRITRSIASVAIVSMDVFRLWGWLVGAEMSREGFGQAYFIT
jgi:hypothetical protein